MKRSLLLMLTGLLFTGLVQAQSVFERSAKASAPIAKAIEVSDNEYIIGYCTDEISESGVGVRQTVTLNGATLFAKDFTERFKGCKVKKILVGFVNNKPTKASVWIKSKLEDTTPIVSQNIETVQAGWNTVELTTPYVLTGEPVYIGFTINQAKDTAPLSFNGEYKTNCALLNYGEGWQDVPNFGCLSIQAVIEGDNLPQNDLKVNPVNVNGTYHSVEDQFSFDVPLFNNGKKNVTSYEITYQIGTGNPVTETVNTDLAYRKTENFTRSVSLAGMSKENEIKIKVNKVNGQDDENVADNEAEASIYVCAKLFPRKVLLEQFTTQKCPNCPAGDAVLEKSVENRDNVIWVAHHVGYGTDDFTVSKSSTYFVFFPDEYVQGGYAPAAMLNRSYMPGEEAPVFGIGYTSAEYGASYVNPFIDYAAAPGFVSVNITGDYNVETSELTVNVTGEKTEELSLVSKKPLITVYLTEDNLVGKQAGATSKFVHENVLRLMMTAPKGEEITWDGNQYTYSVKGKLTASWKLNDMKVIAFVHNWNGREDSAVLNANAIKMFDIPNAVESVENDTDLKIFVENGSVRVDGEYNDLRIYTISGEVVDNVCLTSGMYIVKVSKDNATQVSKIIVK